MSATIHLAHASDVITDEHGSYSDVRCGAVGSYYSTDRADVTCADCLAARTVAPTTLRRGDVIVHLGTRYTVLLTDHRPGGGRVILFVQRCDGSEHRRSIFYGTGETAVREVAS